MNCQGSHLQKFIDLGNQPNGNVFPALEELDKEKMYPFTMLVCTDCWQVQIEDFPSIDDMFTNHPYITGLNKPIVNHFQQLVQDIIKKFEISPNSLVLDIGANDGTLLSKFREQGMRVLGMDPCTKTGILAEKIGVTIAETFWNKESAKALKELGVSPDLITATAVFYHVEDIHSFVQGLEHIMTKDTIFCTQCIYLKDVIEKKQFDHFYHEHTMIHAIAPLKKVFNIYGLRLLDVDFYPIHGGSFVLYVVREESSLQTNKKINDIIFTEKIAGLHQIQSYFNFTKEVERNKQNLVSLLQKIKREGKKVFGLGAPLKGNTLLNYCGIDASLIECVTEINPFKIGRYTPGSHIPVIDEKTIVKHPDYYLVLSWNFLDFFLDKYADYFENGGKFIVPHPNVHVIGKENLLSIKKEANFLKEVL